MAIAKPSYATLKDNIVTILSAVSTADSVGDTSRSFIVERDRWRPWIENQHEVALVNVMVDSARVEPGSGSRRYHSYRFIVHIDMYVLGAAVEQTDEDTGTVTLTPSDKKAADRLDLLIAQVQWGITQMVSCDLGFTPGTIDVKPPTLQIYNQEGAQDIGNYAPARWMLEVIFPFYPADNGTITEMTELNVTFKETLESWGIKYVYGT